MTLGGKLRGFLLGVGGGRSGGIVFFNPFCCTSHFFKRKHVRLLPTGQDIYNVIESYWKTNPHMSFVILDEDFLLTKTRHGVSCLRG